MIRTALRPRRPRRPLLALHALLGCALAACDDGAGPEGGPSTFDVYTYVEVNDTTGMGASDPPVSATVTVASNRDDVVLVDSTGPDGHVRFDDVAAGSYTVSHVATAVPQGAQLHGSAVQTVVAPVAGDSVDTRFLYRFEPDSLSDVAFREGRP